MCHAFAFESYHPGEGGWPSLGLSFFAYVRGNVKKGLKVTKNPYKIFVVGCGRRDGVWGAFFEGGGIILVPAILLVAIIF